MQAICRAFGQSSTECEEATFNYFALCGTTAQQRGDPCEQKGRALITCWWLRGRLDTLPHGRDRAAGYRFCNSLEWYYMKFCD